MSERKQTSGEFVNPLNTRHSSLSAQLFLSVSGLPPLPGSAWMLNTWHKEEVHINTMHLFRHSCTPEGYRGLLFPQTDPNANLWPVLIKIQEQEVNKKFFSCCTWKVAFGRTANLLTLQLHRSNMISSEGIVGNSGPEISLCATQRR